MSIITTIEGGIESGAKLVWTVTPGKVWIMLGAIAAITAAYFGWESHERGIGRDQCKADQAAATAKAQATIDKTAPAENADIHHVLDNVLAPLPDYLNTYAQTAKQPQSSAGCAPVKYERKVQL